MYRIRSGYVVGDLVERGMDLGEVGGSELRLRPFSTATMTAIAHACRSCAAARKAIAPGEECEDEHSAD